MEEETARRGACDLFLANFAPSSVDSAWYCIDRNRVKEPGGRSHALLGAPIRGAPWPDVRRRGRVLLGRRPLTPAPVGTSHPGRSTFIGARRRPAAIRAQVHGHSHARVLARSTAAVARVALTVAPGFGRRARVEAVEIRGSQLKLGAAQRAARPGVGPRLPRRLDPLVERPRVAALRLVCLLYTSPSPRDGLLSRMPSSA